MNEHSERFQEEAYGIVTRLLSPDRRIQVFEVEKRSRSGGAAKFIRNGGRRWGRLQGRGVRERSRRRRRREREGLRSRDKSLDRWR